MPNKPSRPASGKSGISKSAKTGGGWIIRSGDGRIRSSDQTPGRPKNLGGDNGSGGSGEPPKKGE